MALTGEQKKIAIDAYYRTVSKGKHLDVFAAVEAVLADQARGTNSANTGNSDRCVNMKLEQEQYAKDHPEETHCPVCGYYCLGRGGEGCIDKPTLVWGKKARAAEQPNARAWNIVWELAHRDKVFFAGIDGAMARLIEEAQGLLEQPAQPPAGDVVERMRDAYNAAKDQDYNGSPNEIRACMTAALAVAQQERDAQWASWGIVEISVRNKSVAEYMEHWEGRALAAEDNANILRSMVGACHLMISRNNLEELCQQEWNSTDLPPRLYKFIQTQREGYVSQQERDAQWEKAIREIGWYCSGNSTSDLIRQAKERLAKPAEQTDEQKVEAILNRFPWPQGNWASQEQIAAEIVAALRDRKEGK